MSSGFSLNTHFVIVLISFVFLFVLAFGLLDEFLILIDFLLEMIFITLTALIYFQNVLLGHNHPDFLLNLAKSHRTVIIAFLLRLEI